MPSSISEYSFLLLPVALGLMIPAAALPWITINFLGNHDYSPLTIIPGLAGIAGEQESANGIEIADLIASYEAAYYFGIFSQSAFIISIVALGLAAARKPTRSWLAFAAGTLAIASALTWIYSVDSIKDNFAGQAAVMGGVIGEEFNGHENALADALIKLGVGQYFVAAGGVIGLCNAIVNRKAADEKTRIYSSHS